MLPVYVLTNDNHLWLLRGFSYLWGKYAPDCAVTVCGYSPPPFALPPGFTFISLGAANRPAEHWSDGLIQMCREVVGSAHFILMLEDFWLTAPVDMRLVRVASLHGYDDNVLALDLSGTRQASKRALVVGSFAGGEIIETPPGTPYQLSFQAAMWNKARLLEMLMPGETPWESELQGSERVSAARLRVLGVRPALIHYKPVYRAHKSMLILDGVPDAAEIVRRGWTRRM